MVTVPRTTVVTVKVSDDGRLGKIVILVVVIMTHRDKQLGFGLVVFCTFSFFIQRVYYGSASKNVCTCHHVINQQRSHHIRDARFSAAKTMAEDTKKQYLQALNVLFKAAR